ncbi:hypothetical protein E3P94_04168 [Wallemia ichthyophaga]|nr:hypothetical protein E3P98_04165 [Wallemia ichthyophaga]TIA94577.1 hypothetical protein E3P95_04167 [Wallemia ichthyophaga]TIA94813.1 hypothetical protein E3P94_04168 [Wallemia ichthyophaga]
MIVSPFKDIEIPKTSIFDFILPEHQQSNEKTVFIDSTNDNSLTISQLRKYSLQLAYGLRKHQNVGKGDRVLILTPNSLVYPILFMGTQAAGACVSLANPSYNYLELSHQIKDSEVSFIFAHPDNIDLTNKILKEIGWSESKIRERVVSATEKSFRNHVSYAHLLCQERQRGIPENFDGESAHDVAITCYSSGTTGVSKGVMTTHYNMVSNICQSNNTHSSASQLTDVVLSFLPLYHIFGLGSTLYTLSQQQVPQVLLFRYSLDEFAAAIEKYRVTVSAVIPPILNNILKSDIEKKYDLSSLRQLGIGATPLGEDLVHSVSEKLGGLTETSPLVCRLPLEYTKTHPSYVGRLVCNTTARLVDENGQDVPGDNKSSGE